MIARAEPAEALSAPDEVGDMLAVGARDVSSVPVVKAVPVARSQVPRRHEGMSGEALAPDYRRITEVLESGAGAGEEGLSAKELTHRLGLELVPAKIEGVRSRAKRLVERDWLAQLASGRFTLRGSAEAGAVVRARRRPMSMVIDHRAIASLPTGSAS